MTGNDWRQLQTPERIRYNRATAAKTRAKQKYEQARAEFKAAGETFRAALVEEIAAREALLDSLGKPHGTNPD